MEFQTIKVSEDNKVLTVSLNRPDVHNAMNEKLMKELTTCFKKYSKKEGIRVIILTGEGKSFCAGADLNWMKKMVNYSKEENIKDSNLLLELYEAIYNCSKPTVARVNGHAFGGGIGLFAVCDIVFAVPDCKFAFSEVKLGIIPAVISTYIGRRIDTSTMKRMFLTGERFDSEYAKKIGLVDYVFSDNELGKEINKYVKILLASGPNAIKQVKNLIDNYEKLDREKYKKFTVEKISELRVSDEGQEGINAFLEKRKSKWSG